MAKTYIFDIETLGLDPWHGRIISISLKDIETEEDRVYSLEKMKKSYYNRSGKE